MSDDATPHADRCPVRPGAANRLAAARRRPRPRPCRTTRGSRSKSAGWSSAARWTRRASGSAAWSALHQRRALAHRLSVSARRVRRRRSRAGRVRQGLLPHQLVSRGLAVRGLVHADSHQRLPRSAQGARPPRALVRPAARSRAADEARASAAAAADPIPKQRLLVARAPRPAGRARSIASTAGSGPSSCCATTATARRGKSAR